MATRIERNAGTVLTPGLDEEHRAVAWALMERETYISAWRLGYLAVFLLVVAIPIDVFLTALGVGFSISLTRDAHVVFNDSRLVPFVYAALGFVLLTVVVHSAFLALASMDSPALGSGTARFPALRAAAWWIESYLWALRAGMAFVVPPILALFGIAVLGPAIGVFFGLVWMVCAVAVLGDPTQLLAKPRRLLQDLYDRSGVLGSADSRVVSLWTLAWGTAQGVAYAAACIIYLALIALVVTRVVGLNLGVGSASASQGQAAILAIGVLIGLSRAIADGIALLLLAGITLEISKRQHQRERWVRSGRSQAAAVFGAQMAPGAGGVPMAPGGPLGSGSGDPRR
jgi:hypothetical protein